MEFYEKLQELRKSRGLTQEELADALYVSRTAISKWESGRGYPSIDSLKEISRYFSVSIDDLLSGEKLLSLAEKENKQNIRSICDMLFGIVDMCSLMLIVLPLYPNAVDGYIYSVNLAAYSQTSAFNRLVYWTVFIALMVMGIVKIVLSKSGNEKYGKIVTGICMTLSVLAVLFLALSREVYAIAVAFLLLVVKGMLIFKCVKAGG